MPLHPGIQWSLAGGAAVHTMSTQVATLRSHSNNQLTPTELQYRGLHPGPLEPVESKLSAVTIRPCLLYIASKRSI